MYFSLNTCIYAMVKFYLVLITSLHLRRRKGLMKFPLLAFITSLRFKSTPFTSINVVVRF